LRETVRDWRHDYPHQSSTFEEWIKFRRSIREINSWYSSNSIGIKSEVEAVLEEEFSTSKKSTKPENEDDLEISQKKKSKKSREIDREEDMEIEELKSNSEDEPKSDVAYESIDISKKLTSVGMEAISMLIQEEKSIPADIQVRYLSPEATLEAIITLAKSKRARKNKYRQVWCFVHLLKQKDVPDSDQTCKFRLIGGLNFICFEQFTLLQP